MSFGWEVVDFDCDGGAGSGLVGLPDWSGTEMADMERRERLWHGRGGAGVRFTRLAACRHVAIVWFL